MDRQCSSCGGFCRKSGCERENVVDDCYGYASRLAISLSEKHYKHSSSDWKPLDTLIGVLTQIDNMTARLSREKNLTKEWVGLTEEDYVKAWSQSKGDIFMRLVPFARAIEAKLKEKNA